MTTRSLVYVIIQLFLFVAFAAIPGGRAAAFGWQLAAFVLVVSGTLISGAAVLQLGRSLSPLPDPVRKGKLVTTGLFNFVRHPVYSGLLLIIAGISLYSLNFPRSIVGGMLLLLFYFKSGYEEQLLEKKYPDYREYKTHKGRFIPKLMRRQ